jgi:hypothetical protein
VGTQPKYLHATDSNATFTVSKPEGLECSLSATEVFRRGKKARRICFQWRDGDAYEVEIVDYH